MRIVVSSLSWSSFAALVQPLVLLFLLPSHLNSNNNQKTWNGVASFSFSSALYPQQQFTHSSFPTGIGIRSSPAQSSFRTRIAGGERIQQALHSTASSSSSSTSSDTTKEFIVINPDAATDQWELDCYSRPVIVPGTNNKKLWEVLITDSAGSFRFRQELPSNQVNSKTLRQIVDDLTETVDTKPTVIRFFRGAMFNMINIALQELPLTSKASRCTFSLAAWLEERHAQVYPAMPGYNSNMVVGGGTGGGPSFLNVRTPIKLPDALRGEKYAFVALPLSEFLPGGDVTAENIGVGTLCPLPARLVSGSTSVAPADTFVQGVVILSSRAKALASWLAGTEAVSLVADLRKRILLMETDIDTQYLMARLNDQQRAEGAAFEEGKDVLEGLHFVSVQETDESDPEGFWLLRELPGGI